ncbi:hypothetical protein [Ruficoccus sp. ZRK36]|uniref:hypothetical protein n=1 Tax=Ruficoccus sp. ZRK36 TaxID=2866311 RepID=UPI001C7362F9|nr:hypothetical protein [Ruficoccus sp. ZRK36]QYY37436.1 hypothetical protein K0V07_08100 [Ruficoccus sp. ZRK36]
METFDLTSCLKPWAVRLLRPPRTLTKFLKDEDLNGEDIAEWLEYTPTDSPSEEYRHAHFESLLKKYQHQSVEDGLPFIF